MKLLKLVPDNTNIDFMRWRNLALVLSILATVASLALVGVRGPQPRRRLRRRPDDPRHLRPAGRRRAAAQPGRRARPRRRQHPGIRRRRGPTRSACPSPKAARPPPTAPRRQVRAMLDAAISRRPGRCGRNGVGQGQRGAGLRRRAGDRLRDARDRRSTSGSASNGSSASARWSPCSTTCR